MSNETNQHQPPSVPQQEQMQNAQPAQEQPSGNRPVDTLRDGALKLAIFKNERENGVSFAMEPGRLYTDQQGQIRESKSLSGSEPLRMSKLLDKGYDRIGEFKAELKQTQKTERDR